MTIGLLGRQSVVLPAWSSRFTNWVGRGQCGEVGAQTVQSHSAVPGLVPRPCVSVGAGVGGGACNWCTSACQSVSTERLVYTGLSVSLH